MTKVWMRRAFLAALAGTALAGLSGCAVNNVVQPGSAGSAVGSGNAEPSGATEGSARGGSQGAESAGSSALGSAASGTAAADTSILGATEMNEGEKTVRDLNATAKNGRNEGYHHLR